MSEQAFRLKTHLLALWSPPLTGFLFVADPPFCHLSPLMPSTSHDSIGFLSHFLASLAVEMAIIMVSSSIQCKEKSVERFPWKMIAVLTEEVTCSGHCPLLLLQVPSRNMRARSGQPSPEASLYRLGCCATTPRVCYLTASYNRSKGTCLQI